MTEAHQSNLSAARSMSMSLQGRKYNFDADGYSTEDEELSSLKILHFIYIVFSMMKLCALEIQFRPK